MRATSLEFRLRLAIMALVITLGFWSPWLQPWGMGRRISLLAWLALQLSRLGLARFPLAVSAMILVASFLAAAAATLRIWATAYLGPATVNHTRMKAGSVMTAGPYRYLRNPLYLGSWCMVAAMTFLMPPTGALFVMVLLTGFLLRLILGEEVFLARQLGAPYRDYQRTVPRLIPRISAALPPSTVAPQWPHAVLAELNPIGVFITLAFLSWSYNDRLMIKAIIVSFGVSLVARALQPRSLPAEQH